MAKYLDLAGLTAYDIKIKEWIKSGVVDITDEAINALFIEYPSNNEIWYTSTDGNIVNPNNHSAFGVSIVSNEYNDSKGIITFDGDVTNIGGNAFRNCKGLTSVNIPNSVTSIGDYVFCGCRGLTSITIPNSVTSIGYSAFCECFALTSITIPSSVTSIKAFAFDNCYSLTSFTIPESVTKIGNYAFRDCSGLTSVAIPNSVTNIGGSAFQYCSGLTSVTIGNSVTSIGDFAFSSCSSIISMVVESGNTKYDSRENCNAIIETATNKLIVGCQNTIIPNSVTSIGFDAFYGCRGLTSVTIPNSITSIGGSAFEFCDSLKSITYKGTKEQWNTIIKYSDWNKSILATYVKCTDGQVQL